MASKLCQKWFWKKKLSSKSSKFCAFWRIRFGSKFASMWFKYVSNNVWRDFRLPVPAFATVLRKSFNGTFLQKLIFRLGIYVTITYADIGSLKFVHTLFDKYLSKSIPKHSRWQFSYSIWCKKKKKKIQNGECNVRNCWCFFFGRSFAVQVFKVSVFASDFEFWIEVNEY